VTSISHIKAAISVFGCEDLAFSELTARALVYGVRWIGGGEATWSRVDMIADAPEFWGVSLYDGLRSGWGDECYASGDSATSVHFIHDSRSVVSGHGPMNVGYVTDCADTYYAGGAIVNHTTGGVHGSWGGLWGVLVGRFGSSSVGRFYGLDVDVVVEVDRASGEQVVGVGVENGSFADLQDGSIELDITPDGVEATSTNAIGIQTSSGTARSLSTPMELKTTAGSSIPRQDL
jgi:hypothetical protein